MVFHTRAILSPPSSHQDHRMLLYIVACSSDQLSARLETHTSVPSPGIYAVTNLPLLSLNLATLRSPELGFFGFTIPTRKHTPFISGLSTSAGDRALRARCSTRHPRRTWLKVARGEGVEEKVRNGVGANGLAVAATSELRYARVVVGSLKSDETMEETMIVALGSDVRQRSNTLHASDGVVIRRRNVQTNVRRS